MKPLNDCITSDEFDELLAIAGRYGAADIATKLIFDGFGGLTHETELEFLGIAGASDSMESEFASEFLRLLREPSLDAAQAFIARWQWVTVGGRRGAEGGTDGQG